MLVLDKDLNDSLIRAFFKTDDPNEVQCLNRWKGFAYRLSLVASDILGGVIGLMVGVANILTGRNFIHLNQVHVDGVHALGNLVPHIFQMMQKLFIPTLTPFRVRVTTKEGHLDVRTILTGENGAPGENSKALMKTFLDKIHAYDPLKHAAINEGKEFWQVRQIAFMSSGAMLFDEIKSLFYTVIYGARFIFSTMGHITDTTLVAVGLGKSVSPEYWKNMNQYNEAFMIALNFRPAIVSGFYALNILFAPPKV